MVVPPERVGGTNTGDPVWIAGNGGPHPPLQLPIIAIGVTKDGVSINYVFKSR